MGKGIYTRGYLPHWDFEGSVQAVTFRLADSVPGKLIEAWRKELEIEVNELARQKEIHRRISKYEDAGHGESLLKRADCAIIVQTKMIAGHASSYRLIDWCIMPNHVHALFRLEGDAVLAGIVRSWKGGSALEINRLLGRSGPFWQRDYYDRYVRDMDHFHDCRIYIRNNPVKAGLCDQAEDWSFSSAGSGWNPDGAPASAGLEDSAIKDAG
jgi:REP element-mobilizing transposase RayT